MAQCSPERVCECTVTEYIVTVKTYNKLLTVFVELIQYYIVINISIEEFAIRMIFSCKRKFFCRFLIFKILKVLQKDEYTRFWTMKLPGSRVVPMTCPCMLYDIALILM